MDVVRELADRIIVLHNGTLVADGDPATVIASPIVQEAYLGIATPSDSQREQPLPRPAPVVPRGQRTMLLGRNGAGKTTTLRTIMGLWRASQGRIAFGGRDIT